MEALRGLSQPLAALSVEFIPAAIDIAIGCIERLESLGSYQYNWTVGEDHRWQSKNWIDADGLTAMLKSLPINGGSGDFYARRVSLQRLTIHNYQFTIHNSKGCFPHVPRLPKR